jgi:hypothetical protein
MIFSVVNMIFLAVITLALVGIYASYCYIGFDAKPLFEEMVEKWKVGVFSSDPTKRRSI